MTLNKHVVFFNKNLKSIINSFNFFENNYKDIIDINLNYRIPSTYNWDIIIKKYESEFYDLI